MLDIYYKIWVDGITKLRSRPENKGMWKFYAVVFTSMAMAFNIGLLMAIIQRYILKRSFFDVKITIFHQSRLNGFASFFILYLLVPLVINYLLIFRNNRFETLITKYKSYNGKLYATYLVVSFFLPFILIAIAALIGIG
jgi:hypothetical protein